MVKPRPGFNKSLVLPVAICYAVLVPATIAALQLHGFPIALALASAIAIVAASLVLAWATESAQFLVSQSFALAVLALVQVFPEYMFEATLAWHRLITFAAATMTGANRLLLGAAWPLIFFIAFFSARKRGKIFKEIVLDRSQSTEAFFLLTATIYSFVIVAKHTLDIIDTAVLLLMYIAYLYVSFKNPAQAGEEAEEMHGPAKVIIAMKSAPRMVWIIGLLLTGGVVIYLNAEKFVLSLLDVAIILGISQFLFAQWMAPFLSEFPEMASAFYWASTVRLSPMAMGNMVSSKVNQWTLLIGTIPLVYSVSIGQLAFIPLDKLQVEEIFLTAAQSAFGCVALMRLRFDWKDALILFSLWFAQFAIPPIRIEVTYAYLILAAIWLVYYRKQFVMFPEFKKAMREYVFPKK